jgi:hypothetical protein
MGPAAAGLYLPSREFAHPGHELSQKIRESKLSREHDPLFARLLAQSAARHFPDFRPDLVVSPLPRPGQAGTTASATSAASSRPASAPQTAGAPSHRHGSSPTTAA